MKKSVIAFCSLMFAATAANAATSQANLLDVDTHKAEYKSALALYQAQDFDKALPALEVIAKRGEKKAQYILGTMYLNGQGTAQDLKKSYAWLSVANEQKNKHWKRPLNMLDDKLPKDYLNVVSEEAEKFQSLYGVKAQKMKCRNTKTLGSKKPTHLCTKTEVKDGYYFVASQELASN